MAYIPGLFDQRKLIQAVRQIPPSYNFLTSTFFETGTEFTTETVEAQFKKSQKKLAPYVSPLQPGKVVLRDGYQVNFYKPALIKPARPITAIDLQQKQFGEDPYSDISPEQRARELLATDLDELLSMIDRRIEQQVAEVLTTGKLVQIGEGVENIVDYEFTNKVTLSGTDVWSNPAAKILANIRTWRLSIIQKTGITPDWMIVASDVTDFMINNPEIKDLLDIRRYEFGRVEPRQLPNGVTYVMTIASLGIDVYNYDETYVAEGSEELIPMIPSGTVLLLSSRVKNKIHYGSNIITDLSRGTLVNTRGAKTPQSWVTPEPAQRWLQVLSRPLPLPYDVDAWYVAKVL